MKKFTHITILALCIGFVGCSDSQQEKADEALRHQNSAKVYREQGQLRAAMLEAKNVIQLQPESSTGYIALAKIYNDIGAYAATQTMLETIVAKLPDVATELADAYFYNKKYRTVLNTIKTYPAANDNVAVKQRQLWLAAMSNIYLGDNDEYTKALAELTAVGAPENQRKYVEANYLLSKGDIAQTQVLLESILQKEPENLDVLILMGSVSIFTRQLDKAEQYLTKALGLLPNTDILGRNKSQVISLLTESLIQQGRTSEAYTYQKLLAEANPEGNAAQQRFNEAMELYQQGKFADAERILTELREQFPNDKNTATLLGMVEFQQGSDQDAANLFDEFIDPETATPTIIQAAALVKYRNNKVDEAVALLKKAAESQPNNASVLATYGLALLDQDKKSDAGAKALEKSLALDPKQQRIRIALAKRHFSLGQAEQGIAQLKKAYEELPNDLVIQQTYLQALFANDQANTVKEEVKAFKQKFPDNPRGFFFEGWYLLEQKKYTEAEQAFERAVSMANNTEKHLSYAGLAQIYESQNTPQKAVTAWQLALEAEPGMAVAYGRWLAQMKALNRDKEAVQFVTDLEKKTTRWEPSVVLAQLLVSQRKLAEAISHIEVAYQRSNGGGNIKQIAANLYRLQGVELRKQNQLPEARESYMKAVKLYPENASFLGNLIETEIAAKNISEAQKLLDQFVKTPENESERLFLQGLIRFAENNPDEGIKLYLQAWAAKPMETIAEAIHGFYVRSNKLTEADVFVDDWVIKIPGSSNAALIKAVSAQKNNKPDEALKWYEKTVELQPNLPAALNNLAWMYYEKKDPRALEYAKKAYDLAPGAAPVIDTYGWILVETGDVKKGVEILTEAVKLAPDNEEIQRHLREAKSRVR